MKNFTKFEGRLIRLNKEYPICNEDDEIIGYTSADDLAVITFAEINETIKYQSVEKISDNISFGVPIKTGEKDGYFETVIVSGKYMGVDTLALNLDDIEKSTFIFNKIDDGHSVYIQNNPVGFEYV
jgi:hypothetical protein